MVEGMIFSRLSPNGVLRIRIAPDPRTARYVQSQRRSVHNRKDRLCGALVVEFEQCHGDGPFRHASREIDHAVDATHTPVSLAGIALFRAKLPEAVEHVDIGQAVADELLQALVGV